MPTMAVEFPPFRLLVSLPCSCCILDTHGKVVLDARGDAGHEL